jgi:hypothetical protein
VREAIEAAGARLLFLPRYSPDFNPIEIRQHRNLSRRGSVDTPLGPSGASSPCPMVCEAR